MTKTEAQDKLDQISLGEMRDTERAVHLSILGLQLTIDAMPDDKPGQLDPDVIAQLKASEGKQDQAIPFKEAWKAVETAASEKPDMPNDEHERLMRELKRELKPCPTCAKVRGWVINETGMGAHSEWQAGYRVCADAVLRMMDGEEAKDVSTD